MSCIVTLKEKGLKLTPQRRLIADVIHASAGHLTVEEIVAHVQARMPGVNKSTIYRTMELLEEAGCVYRSQLEDRFIYHHAEEGHHHHLVCIRCGKSLDCDEAIFEPVQNCLDEKYGFHVRFQHFVLRGLCQDCRGMSKSR